MLRRLCPPSLRRPLAVGLVCAMLLAQMLGLAHRVAHAGGPQAAAGHELRAGSLFDTHHDVADCRLFEQLSHADAPGIDWATTASSTPPSAPDVEPAPADITVAHGAYLARGPPAQA